MVRSYFVFVKAEIKKNQEMPTPELYYWENGLIVFTAAYHRQRGFCCQSGCRHCPWNFKKPAKRPVFDKPLL